MRRLSLRPLAGHLLAACSPDPRSTHRLLSSLPRTLASALVLALALALACLGTLPSVAQPSPPPSESSAARDARMQWWRDARFGMFVHWGLYSGLAGTWQGQPVGTTGGMEWIQERVKADTESYARAAIPLFQPKPGFARDWARLAREAGCRYVVFTTKHHDGFALHDSKVSDFDAGSVLQRDLVREIVTALRAEGLRVGFYHSVIDWHHDQYSYSLSQQLPHPLKGRPYPNGSRDHARYLDFLHAQVKELVTGYGPIDILWWDYSSQDFQGDPAWRATELMANVRAHHPGIIMNNRLYRSRKPVGPAWAPTVTWADLIRVLGTSSRRNNTSPTPGFPMWIGRPA